MEDTVKEIIKILVETIRENNNNNKKSIEIHAKILLEERKRTKVTEAIRNDQRNLIFAIQKNKNILVKSDDV